MLSGTYEHPYVCTHDAQTGASQRRPPGDNRWTHSNVKMKPSSVDMSMRGSFAVHGNKKEKYKVKKERKTNGRNSAVKIVRFFR